jgi:hypothetical protein
MAKTDLQKLIDKVSELLNKTLTGTNPLVITDTADNDNIEGMSIYAITDTTFTTLNTSAGGNSLIGQTLLAGNIWYIPIKGTVKLASGSVIVYRHTNS